MRGESAPIPRPSSQCSRVPEACCEGNCRDTCVRKGFLENKKDKGLVSYYSYQKHSVCDCTVGVESALQTTRLKRYGASRVSAMLLSVWLCSRANKRVLATAGMWIDLMDKYTKRADSATPNSPWVHPRTFTPMGFTALPLIFASSNDLSQRRLKSERSLPTCSKRISCNPNEKNQLIKPNSWSGVCVCVWRKQSGCE